ncbi:predicted protein [Naegleria gruberi]|uniref:Predicted protein n=1 Tax=Naegleria gruberi TaxID=5762 RepID=D2V746_NAEGR|nr:uncharacterized protein NAEGRDRAFT_78856 [Naegleria gruberi]EFC47306.1 predicted protein [Naegleria gruberi]|eukprot:XP_002680050.1 predicted protein [Naegleria gruberi strain NEG-M]
MSSSLMIEQTRLAHTDVEQAIKSVIYEIKHKARTQKHIVYQNHRINYHIEQIQQKSNYLLTTCYGQTSEACNTGVYDSNTPQIQSMKNQITETTQPNTINSFYSKLEEIKDYHRRFAVKIENRNTSESNDEQAQRKVKQRVQQEIKVLFTDEELYGRYVDLNAHYNAFVDLINEQNSTATPPVEHKTIDYVEYLVTLGQFDKLSLDLKNQEKYKSYLESLLDYFIDFMNRTQPLMGIKQMVDKLEEEFDTKCTSGDLPEHWKFLVKLMEKSQPEKDQPTSEQNSSAQGKKKKRRGGKRKSNHNVDKLRSIALMEYKISKFLTEWLSDVIQQTKIYVEKKSTRTWEENQAEMERIEKQMDKEDDDEQQEQQKKANSAIDPNDPLSKYASKKNNPLNLPIGPDGKPIPYWLYKFQGLGNEYICEICGNHSYWGHKEFEKHFQEWRHANGMKILGIPNTRHFHHITKIKDAVELWKSMQNQDQQQSWDQSEMEEVEDAEGNVYTKQTYLDLKKQGVIKH